MRNAMKPVLKFTLVLSAILSQSVSFADRKWNDANDPRNLDSSYKMNFYQLPPAGDVSNTNKGWSSSYYPKTRGLIAERWQDPSWSGVLKFKKYPLPYSGSIPNMSQAELNLLSPAEKFDIVRGKYDLPLVNKLREDDPDPKKDWWRGLCNGWTQAAVNIAEPHPIVFTNPKTKISVPLNTGDIKGLMAYYYANRDRNNSKYIGKSCRAGKKLLFDIDGSCKDVNAAAFHVALTNEIGLKKNPLAIDRDPSVQVWNQPFVKYESVIDREDRNVSSKATDGTVKEVYVTTTAYYANEQYKIDPSEIAPGKTREMYEDDEHSLTLADPVLGTENQVYGHKVYKYVLELNSRDQIIGGDWLNDSDFHPDLIWKQNFTMPGMGYDKDGKADDWSILKDIILQATAYATGN